MFWYYWLGGDNVLGNELIKSILIRVQEYAFMKG
jgi:hypothetical protein